MKHALILLIILISAYIAFNITPSEERNSALRVITKHALFIGAIILLVLVVLAFASYFPASSLI